MTSTEFFSDRFVFLTHHINDDFIVFDRSYWVLLACYIVSLGFYCNLLLSSHFLQSAINKRHKIQKKMRDTGAHKPY